MRYRSSSTFNTSPSWPAISFGLVLSNVARHSSAGNVVVALDFQNTSVQFSIIDDGVDFKTQQQYDVFTIDSGLVW
jgi:signal transduction histidine kinase